MRLAGPDDHQFVLASGSPRRRELLEACGLRFETRSAEIDESPLAGETPEDCVLRLARAKAAWVRALRPDLPVLSADTVVALEGAILGKPGSLAEARDMLGRLSGRVHRVATGFCVLGGRGDDGYMGDVAGMGRSGLVVSRIAFRDLSQRDIDWYLSLGQSMDKAGAYAIQMEGGFLADWIDGSYTNIVGLPLRETLEALYCAIGRPSGR
jgi:septum formation protein